MTAIDTNVLVGVIVSSSSLHQEAFSGINNIEDDLCTTSTNIGETLRLITHSKVFEKPLTLAKAIAVLSDLLESYQIRVLDEDVDWWKNLIEIEKHVKGLRGNEIFDAKIAICLRQHGVKRLYTMDSDFKKYPFLQCISPLSSN